VPVQIVVMYAGYTGDDVCTGDTGDDEADDDIIFVCVCTGDTGDDEADDDIILVCVYR